MRVKIWTIIIIIGIQLKNILLLIQVFTWDLEAPCALSYSTVRKITLPWSVYSLKDINKQKGDRDHFSSCYFHSKRAKTEKADT